jgi:catechol 2,3-dioxygenase-like lactoylglutathione lyase family enzyme
MPARGIHHVDLAVSDVARSLDFYLTLLGPLGLYEFERYPSYRGTEEVVYLHFASQLLGLRRADSGPYRYYTVGLEHLAFYVDTPAEVDAAYERCIEMGAHVHFPPEESKNLAGYYEMFVFDPDGLRIEIGSAPRD